MAYQKVNKGFLVEAFLLDNRDSKSYNISDSIKNILVRKRFLTERYPLFVIEAVFEKEVYEAISENSEISVSLNISSFNTDELNNSTGDVSNEIAADGEVLDIILRIYQSDFLDYQNNRTGDEENSENDVEVAYYRLAGIPENLVQGNTNIINSVFTDCKLSDIAVHLLSQVGSNDIYIEPFSNNVIYKNIIIPPLNIVPSMYFLHQNYNFYEKPMGLFFDSKRSYLYSPHTTKDDGTFEYSYISKENTANISLMNSAEYDSELNRMRIFSTSSISYSDNKNLNRDTLGSETIFYTYDDSFDLKQKITNNASIYDKKRYFWNSTSENYQEKEFSTMNLTDMDISLSLSHVNPEFFTPITEILVNSDSESDGRYAISEVAYILTTSDRKHYNSSIKVSAIKK